MKDLTDIFISGNKINLKVLSEDDVLKTNWYNWFNDEETTKYMQKHYFPNTKQDQLIYFNNNIQGSKTKLQLGICRKDSPKLLGCISLEEIDFLNRKAEISTIMGENEGRNIEVIIEAYQLIINHGFRSLNLNRIYTGTISKEFSTLMVRVFGFTLEGTKRQDVFKNGKYNDVFIHSLLKQEYDLKNEQ